MLNQHATHVHWSQLSDKCLFDFKIVHSHRRINAYSWFLLQVFTFFCRLCQSSVWKLQLKRIGWDPRYIAMNIQQNRSTGQSGPLRPKQTGLQNDRQHTHQQPKPGRQPTWWNGDSAKGVSSSSSYAPSFASINQLHLNIWVLNTKYYAEA